jgi:hypothetical protein
MNHIYKSVWNIALGAWVAVGELTKAHGKTKSSRAASSKNGASVKHGRSAALLLAAGLSSMAQPVLAADPGGPVPAATYEWNYATDGTAADWNTTTNWTPTGVPAAADTAQINNGGGAGEGNRTLV